MDFESAAMAACKEYCLTEAGRKVYEHNCNNFIMMDFCKYVPNNICEKYGIRKIEFGVAEDFIFDQQLVDETDIFPEE